MFLLIETDLKDLWFYNIKIFHPQIKLPDQSNRILKASQIYLDQILKEVTHSAIEINWGHCVFLSYHNVLMTKNPHTAIHLLFSGDERFNIKVSVMIQNETTKEEQNDTSTNKTKWAMTQYHRDCKDRNNIIKHSNKVCISIQATTSTIHTHSQVSRDSIRKY